MRILYTLFSVGFLFISFTVNCQRSKNGTLTVSSASTCLNSYTAVTSSISSGATSIQVASNLLTNSTLTAPLSAGDLILIIQMQGATMDIDVTPTAAWGGNYTIPTGYLSGGWLQVAEKWGQIVSYNSAGKYELVEVLSVSGSTQINLSCAVVNNYQRGGHVQVVRVPRLVNLQLNSPGSIVAQAWDGSVGGVVALEINGDLTFGTGTSISATGKGFRGGILSNTDVGVTGSSTPSTEGAGNGSTQLGSRLSSEGGRKGEGIGGYTYEYDSLYSRYGRGSAANGGGGGGFQNAGGGGGANVGSGTFTGKGVPSTSYANSIWELEMTGFSNSSSSGGGRGGYSYSNSNQNATTVGPNQSSWGGDTRKVNGGLGGHPLAYDATRVFLGGGGGSGDQDSGQGGSGGQGGGIVFLDIFGNVFGSGTIEANGNAGQNSNPLNQNAGFGQKKGNDGAGGGGAGGSLIIRNLHTLPSTLSLQTKGGAGGNHNLSLGGGVTASEGGGPGGGGSGGNITFVSGSPVQQVSAGANGTSNSAHLTEFVANGATNGAAGLSGLTTTSYDISLNDTTICGGQSVTLHYTIQGTSPGMLSWYTSLVGGAPIYSGNDFVTPVLTSTTTFYVGYCPGSFREPVTVTVGSSPIISGVPVVTHATCSAPGSISGLAVSGGASPYLYTWNGAVSTSTDLSNATPGSYTLLVEDQTGCADSLTNVIVGGTTGPTLNTSFVQIQNVLCSNSLGSVSGISVTGGATPYNYQWTGGPTASNSLDLLGANSGNYTLTITDANNCTASYTTFIDSIAGVVLDESSVTVVNDACLGTGTISGITATGGVTPYQFVWNNSSTSVDLVGVQTGSYTLIITDMNGCKDTSASYAITSELGPQLSTSNLVVTNVSCSGQLGSINGITLNGGMSPVQVSWNSNPQLNTLDISNLNVGTYVLVVNDAQGCTDTDTIVLLPPVAPVIDSTNVQILMPTCLQMGYITGLTVTGSQLTYSWTNSNETSLTIDSILPGMTYMLTVTNAYNCSDTYGPIVFNNLPSVNANFSGPEFTSLGESVTFTSNSTGVPNLSYDWFVDNAFWLGTSVTANYQADSLGVHEVILIVTDGNGCQDTIIKTIEVVTDMVIPNVFTPNNDSENDVFLIKNIPPKTELFVLDRWGLIVYSSSEYNNDWKGLSSQGLELTEGVYFYKVIPPVGSPMEGFFHLIR